MTDDQLRQKILASYRKHWLRWALSSTWRSLAAIDADAQVRIRQRLSLPFNTYKRMAHP